MAETEFAQNLSQADAQKLEDAITEGVNDEVKNLRERGFSKAHISEMRLFNGSATTRSFLNYRQTSGVISYHWKKGLMRQTSIMVSLTIAACAIQGVSKLKGPQKHSRHLPQNQLFTPRWRQGRGTMQQILWFRPKDMFMKASVRGL